ncbi:MAG: hypothetical protein IIC50_03355 [Planctomycetes bacterium]|nr:hypothetical protein [Planctomycetota bacterium]
MAHIIRRAEVQLEDPYVLDLTKVRCEGQQSSPEDVPDRVRVVESDSHFTILEVTCGCGQKTYVRCDH